MSYSLFFGALGTGLACYSNVLRKLPVLRREYIRRSLFSGRVLILTH